MKKRFFMMNAVGIFFLFFSLKFLECASPDEQFGMRDECKRYDDFKVCLNVNIPLNSLSIELDQDFSPILGSEVFVNYFYTFFDRAMDLFAEMDEKGRQLIALYPGEPVSLHWEKDLDVLSPVLMERENYMKLMFFTTCGAYKASEYQDREMLSEFKDLQTQIVYSVLKDIFLFDDYQKEKIDEETFYSLLGKIEEDITLKMRHFCKGTKDAFFSENVSVFLNGVTTRFEAFQEYFPIDKESDFAGETKAEMAFADLEKDFSEKANQLIMEMFSPLAIQNLTLQLMTELDFEGSQEEMNFDEAL